MKKFLLTFMAVVCMAIGFSTIVAHGEIYTGRCGDKITYALDTEKLTITISGEGDMYEQSMPNSVPWYNYRDYIKSVVIENGVTNVGNYAFLGSKNLVNVVIPNSVVSIESYAFFDCESLANILIPSSIDTIGNNAFYLCSDLLCALYEGSESDLSIEKGNDDLKNALIYNTKGECGKNIVYTLDFSGLLTISGSGDMYNYSTSSESISPWFKNKKFIKSANISNAITSVGSYAFYSCHELCDVYYDGSKSEWEKINIELGNNSLLNATFHYAKEDDDTSSIPDTEGKTPQIGKTIFIFTPIGVNKGDIIAALVTKDGVSTSYVKTYSGEGEVVFEIENGFNSIKVLVWDSYETMEPLMEEYATIE